MREVLYGLMQTYAAEVTGTPVIYDSSAYPYFFIDTDGDESFRGRKLVLHVWASW